VTLSFLQRRFALKFLGLYQRRRINYFQELL
jgi:hypothetical protein